MEQLDIIQRITVAIIPLLFAIVFHEVAHGWVALKCGDQTAKLMGRLTLNPIKHIDLFGTLILPVLMLLFSPFIFGWAKPVPIDLRNLRNPKRDIAIIAIAGPLANLLMALGWAAMMKLALLWTPGNEVIAKPLFYMGKYGLMINVVLAILNILPIPPLDGSRVLMAFLSKRSAYFFSRIEPYGFYIIIFMLFTGIFSMIVKPPVLFLLAAIANLFGL